MTSTGTTQNKVDATPTLKSYLSTINDFVTTWMKSLQISYSNPTHPKQNDVIITKEIKAEPFEIIFPSKRDPPEQPLTGYKLEQYLKSVLVEQHLAIKSICYALIRQSTIWNYQQGATDQQRSITLPTSFLFVGPGGVGKIYLAKALAQGQKRPFVYFDMKLFIDHPERFLSDFISGRDGSPQDGQLNVVLKRAPNAVIVLNHLELASAKIFNLLFELWQRGAINKTVTARVLDNKKDRQITTATVSIIDASKAIFICMTDVDDQVVKQLISSSQPHRERVVHRTRQPSFKHIESSRDDDNDSDILDHVKTTSQKKNDQLKMMFANGKLDLRHRSHDPKNLHSRNSIRHQEDAIHEADEDGFSALDALDSIVEFRHKIVPILLDHFNKSGTPNGEIESAKCHDAIIERFNAIIPFFEFDAKQLKIAILLQLKNFSEQCATITESNKRQLKLTWGEDVLIWLMKRYRPSLSVQGLLENHVLTLLAACDDIFHNGDHIHLAVSTDDQRLFIQIINKRADLKLKQSLGEVRSKL
jgi:hypothetical protein